MRTVYLLNSIQNRRNLNQEIYLCDVSEFLPTDDLKYASKFREYLMSLSAQELKWKLWRMAFPERVWNFIKKIMRLRIKVYFE